MNAVIIVIVIFGSIVTLAGLLCGTILVLSRMRHSGMSRSGGKASSEETKMIQEIYRGLELMEQRIEALETILMDGRDKNGETK